MYEEEPDEEAPEGFTAALALLDAVPVIEFGFSMMIVASRLESLPFVAGALLCTLAGYGKVLWKLILAFLHADVALLSRQFKYLMGAGAALLVIGVVVSWGSIDAQALMSGLTAYPVCACFVVFVAAMVAMGVMGAVLDKRIARNNWIEEIVNTVGQTALLAGVILF